MPVLKDMETIALVKRGQCNWSEKLRVIENLSNTYHLNVTATCIYDNQTYPEITIKSSMYQNSIDFPSYSSPLPSDRSASSMADNDLTESPMGIYFLPYSYGSTLKGKINSTFDSENSTLHTYWTLTSYLEQKNSSNGFIGSIRGYLAYIIALAAIFLIGIIFLRWWRIRRMRDNMRNDVVLNNGILLQPRGNQVDPLPVDIVNSLPIKQYQPSLSKNVNCVICLEDFLPGKTDIRILPCGHGFCVLCIDPWLTQKSTLCPICKWDCLPSETRQERLNSDSPSSQSVTQDSLGNIVIPTDQVPESSSVSQSHTTINIDSTQKHAESKKTTTESTPAVSIPIDTESTPINAESTPINPESASINAESTSINNHPVSKDTENTTPNNGSFR